MEHRKKLFVVLIVMFSFFIAGCNSKHVKSVTLSQEEEKDLDKQTLSLAIKSMAEKNYKAAYPLWRYLSNKGDPHATVQVGLMYHRGQGRPVDYVKAMNWYLKVYKTNGDAMNNIGVMHRDALGVPKNRKIAYRLFLNIHNVGMGPESTIIRANRNLRREIRELTTKEKQTAMCYNKEYILSYVDNRGSQPEEAHQLTCPKNIKH